MSEWKEYKLSDIADIVAGYAFKSKEFGCIGMPVVKIKDINPPYVDIDNADKVDISIYPKGKMDKYKIGKGDYVIAMTGATIGKVGRVRGEQTAYINQRVAKIKAKQGVDNNFVYYAISRNDFQQFIQNNIDSNSAQENISATSIGKFPIWFPPMEEQKRIAGILSALDDKIELNRRINANLELQAQTLFNHWFVDFEFPNADGKPYKSSGGKLIDSPLGPIPIGWEICKIEDVCALHYGKSLTADKRLLGNIPVYSSAGITGWHNESLSNEEGIIIGRKGKVGTIFYSSVPFYCIDTAYYILPCDVKCEFWYLYYSLQLLNLDKRNEDSVIPGLNRDTVYSQKIILPPIYEQKRLMGIFEYVNRQIEVNKKQCDDISNLRDTLLPKLMNREK